jgi:hypothetical protein
LRAVFRWLGKWFGYGEFACRLLRRCPLLSRNYVDLLLFCSVILPWAPKWLVEEQAQCFLPFSLLALLTANAVRIEQMTILSVNDIYFAFGSQHRAE